jgi:hypothetical protein
VEFNIGTSKWKLPGSMFFGKYKQQHGTPSLRPSFNSGCIFENPNTIAFYFYLFAPIHFYWPVIEKYERLELVLFRIKHEWEDSANPWSQFELSNRKDCNDEKTLDRGSIKLILPSIRV